MTEGRFLTARWEHLAMLNYEIDEAALSARVPRGCELDRHEGRLFVSVVGFRFLDTRVLGIPVPFHRDFEEVNLRFYVRSKHAGEWRRGVVFVKELVPRGAIAWVARELYGENYEARPMSHRITPSEVSYEWQQADRDGRAVHGPFEGLTLHYSGEPELTPDDSEETFITEHYWGYAKQKNGGTVEYQVEHPRWRVWRAERASLRADVAALYGPEFVEALSGAPSTAFLADGSAIIVRKGRRIAE